MSHTKNLYIPYLRRTLDLKQRHSQIQLPVWPEFHHSHFWLWSSSILLEPSGHSKCGPKHAGRAGQEKGAPHPSCGAKHTVGRDQNTEVLPDVYHEDLLLLVYLPGDVTLGTRLCTARNKLRMKIIPTLSILLSSCQLSCCWHASSPQSNLPLSPRLALRREPLIQLVQAFVRRRQRQSSGVLPACLSTNLHSSPGQGGLGWGWGCLCSGLKGGLGLRSPSPV